MKYLFLAVVVFLTGCSQQESVVRATPTVTEYQAFHNDQSGNMCERTAREDVNAAKWKEQTNGVGYDTELRLLRKARGCLP